jgi:cell division protein FtsB
MNEIPMWWLILSGIFFAIVAVLFVVLCMLVGALIKVVLALQPQVSGLLTQVNDLVPTVKNLVTKVEALTDKVDGIADSTRSTVDIVGARAKGIATSVDQISGLASQNFAKFAPILGTLMAGLRIFKMYQEYRSASNPEPKGKAKGGMKIELGEPPEE